MFEVYNHKKDGLNAEAVCVHENGTLTVEHKEAGYTKEFEISIPV